VDGTTITEFNEDALKRMCASIEGEGKSRESEHEESEDDTPSIEVDSLVRRGTQRSLSSLTEVSQKNNNDDTADHRRDRAACNDDEKRMAMEALMLVRWMRRGGVNEILRDGNLARLVFGICVPSYGSSSSVGASDDELIESYSFDISYKRPTKPGEVDENEVHEAFGSVFQNLNGFQAGRSLSQSVVPSKTQSSCLSLSQSSRGPSQGGGTQMSSVGYSPLSQVEMAQKSLMESMSQSIRVSVKKNRGRSIPKTRYMTLRVEFANSVSPNKLPPLLKQNLQEVSPASIVGRTADELSRANRFVVTPLGKIKLRPA
jgi:hypothetical protein